MQLTPLEYWIVNKSGIKKRERKAIEEYQLYKVIETIHYAKKNSQFYSDKLKNINEDELHSLEDLRDIPFTYSYQIKQNPLGFLCIPQREIKRIVTLNSSGTNGEQKRIYFNEGDLNLWNELLDR